MIAKKSSGGQAPRFSSDGLDSLIFVGLMSMFVCKVCNEFVVIYICMSLDSPKKPSPSFQKGSRGWKRMLGPDKLTAYSYSLIAGNFVYMFFLGNFWGTQFVEPYMLKISH